jgi:tetratricopeptide (TPR) repeat protein
LSPEKRITKRQMKQDKLVSTAFKATEYVQARKNYFLIGLVSLVVVVMIIYFINYNITKKNNESIELFGKGQIAAAMGQADLAVSDYKNVVKRYGSNRIASRACYFLANIYKNQNKYDSAMVYYELFINKYGQEKILLIAAHAGMAICLEEKGEFTSAGDSFYKAAELADNDDQSPGYLMSAGRNYAKDGQYDKAQNAYQQIVDKYKRSTQRSMAQKKIAELEYKN